MASSLKSAFSVSGLNETVLSSKTKDVWGFCPSVDVIKIGEKKSNFMGRPLVLSNQDDFRDWSTKSPSNCSVRAQASICVGRAMRWWEKTLKPNMIEIHSAQELVVSLHNAGDRLVIVDFYSPGCGGCKALHPKLCQLAESNPDAIFLKVNYEELKTMCHSLHIHVLPFFRFYRGSQGRVCSFSCTNATIKKFKDALTKQGADGCDQGPAKGLDESEILALASAGELPINLPLPSTKEEKVEELIMGNIEMPGVWGKNGNKMDLKEETAVGV